MVGRLATTTRTIKANCMDFVKIGHCVIFICKVADFFYRGDIAIHGINRFKGDNFGAVRVDGFKLVFQIAYIVMAEYPFFAPRMTHTINHGGVVELIGQDHTAWQ